MRRLPILAAGLILWSAAPATADETYDRCMDAASTSLAMSECGTGLVERADVRLNEVWKKVYPRLHNPRAKAELLEAQRLWIKYKDESCQFYAGSDFGSAGNSIAGPACRARVINDRTELLEQIVCKDEGEVSCL